MPTIIIDGQPVKCRPGIPVLQAALEAGFNIPHYCYHPGLSVVASCRLCLMEMKVPRPGTTETVWSPRLFPSCQTPVRDGLEVRFNSEKVRQSQRQVIEYYLLNHPLDCPICDKAGECYLQDYAEQFGPATSRMVEDKIKNPKKDLGPHTLLYQDRCVLCSRCVRFCQEIAGTGELTVVNRGSHCEIDAFPGIPLNNPLQGNVVDLCPVGALLDKDFLFKQRVWLLRSARSVSPADSSGQTIWIDYNEEGIHRIRPRYNEKVNQWWISDEARFYWKLTQRPDRVCQLRRREGSGWVPLSLNELPGLLRQRFGAAAGSGRLIGAVLSPMMSCEEAFLLARFVRDISPQAVLVLGFVPVEGTDRAFPGGFVIRAEKCPNRRGLERILEHFGEPQLTLGDFLSASAGGKFAAVYFMAGYARPWVQPDWLEALRRIEFLVVHDLFASPLDEIAAVRIPGASWAEREGSFMNCDGLLQPFERSAPPPQGVAPDGQLFYELAGRQQRFCAAHVRQELARAIPDFEPLHIPQELPPFAH